MGAIEAGDFNAIQPGMLHYGRLAPNLTDIPNLRQQGTRLGNWFSEEQARELLMVPARNSLKVKRDYAILALLVGCGLTKGDGRT